MIAEKPLHDVDALLPSLLQPWTRYSVFVQDDGLVRCCGEPMDVELRVVRGRRLAVLTCYACLFELVVLPTSAEIAGGPMQNELSRDAAAGLAAVKVQPKNPEDFVVIGRVVESVVEVELITNAVTEVTGRTNQG